MNYLFGAGAMLVISAKLFFESGSTSLLNQSIVFYVCVALFFVVLEIYRAADKRDLRNDPHYFIVLIPTAVACIVPMQIYGWSPDQMLYVALPVLALACAVDALLRKFRILP